MDNSKRLGELFAKYRESIFEEIEDTNPHLSWGISKLLNPLVSLGPDQVFAGVNGIVNQYSTLKTASRLYNHRKPLETPPSFRAGRKTVRAQNRSGKILRWELRHIAIV